jgi:hypothetical protein
MEKTPNRISSPEATGGAGPTFEQKVGVYWLAQLLVGCIPPIFVDSVVERVAFQTEHFGWNTDDMLITCVDGASHTKQLAAQVKRTFAVSASDGECEKTILDFWKDFNKSDNFTVHDRFLLITQRGTNTLLDHFAGLLDCARSAQDAEDFEHRLTTPGFISAKSVDYADEIVKIVNTAQSVPHARKSLWSFFRSLHVLSLDLTADAGQAEAAMKSLLAFTAVGKDGIGAADMTWNALLKEVGNGTPGARAYKLADLPNILRQRHSRIEVKDQRFKRFEGSFFDDPGRYRLDDWGRVSLRTSVPPSTGHRETRRSSGIVDLWTRRRGKVRHRERNRRLLSERSSCLLLQSGGICGSAFRQHASEQPSHTER